MNKKAYQSPECRVVTADATPILAGTLSITGKSDDEGGPALDDGGSTDDENNKGIVFNPW